MRLGEVRSSGGTTIASDLETPSVPETVRPDGSRPLTVETVVGALPLLTRPELLEVARDHALRDEVRGHAERLLALRAGCG